MNYSVRKNLKYRSKKAFSKLVSYIGKYQKNTPKKVLRGRLMDSIASLDVHCKKHNYEISKSIWNEKMGWAPFRSGFNPDREEMEVKVKVSVKKQTETDVEVYPSSTLTSIGIDAKGKCRVADLKACAQICSTLGIVFKPLRESSYFRFTKLDKLKIL